MGIRLCCMLWLALVSATAAHAREFSIDHLEPAHWWVGMKHHRVELMVHGKEISRLSPRISRAGVRVAAVDTVANPNYLFFTLDIADDARPGRFDIEFLDATRVAVRHPFRLDARAPGSASRKGFDASDAIYLIVPDRFANGDPAQDNVAGLQETADRAAPNGRHGGDIAGIRKHLDYIAGMGFTQLWPTPLLENNQPRYSYHGYAITDLYRIDPRFGSNDDYRQMALQARGQGVGVIMDVVLNHIGSSHWWMQDLPTPDWIHNGGTFTPTNHRRTTVQDPHAAAGDRDAFLQGWFSPGMPDLNQRNPHLATYLIQNTLWWIEYAGLSGIREDTFGYADSEFLSAWAKAVLDEYPDFSMVGEEWSNSPGTVAHWQRGKVNPDGHVPYMPSMMDFPLHIALRDALKEAEGNETGWVRPYEALASDYQYPDPARLVVFAENHDTTRLLAHLDGDVAAFKLAMAYLATMRGTPQFFYGSEVLLRGPAERKDGELRADMPGGWRGDAKDAFTGQGLSLEERDAQSYVRALLQWRRGNRTVQHGQLLHYAPVDGVYVYFRHDAHGKVMVALNRNAQATTLKLARFAPMLAPGSQGRDVISGKTVLLQEALPLPAQAATVLEIH